MSGAIGAAAADLPLGQTGFVLPSLHFQALWGEEFSPVVSASQSADESNEKKKTEARSTTNSRKASSVELPKLDVSFTASVLGSVREALVNIFCG